MLLARERAPALETLERLAGLQAQEPRPPFVGLWSRLKSFERDELDAALKEGSALRGLLMRATLHTVSAGDYRLFRAPLQPMMSAAFAGVRVAKGVDLEPVLPVARELLSEAPRTMGELRSLLSERFPDVNHRALGYGVRTHLPLAMVPSDDRWGFPRDAKFALADADADDSPAPLVRRYLAAFGPATPADAQTWSGLKGLKAVFDELRDELAVFTDENGREVFDLPDAPRPDPDAPAPARLLPEFDNLVLSHADRTRILDDDHRPRVVTKNLRVKATILIDGRVQGTWKSERKGKKATLTLEPFKKLKKAERDALTAEAEALLHFTEEDAASIHVRLA
jgi:DNA glycosylase AlkZ-like